MERVRAGMNCARFRQMGARLFDHIMRSRGGEQTEPLLELAAYLCETSQQTRVGRADPMLEQLNDNAEEFMERTYFRPARFPGTARNSGRGIKDIVYLFRAYNDLHGYALQAARDEREVINECIQRVEELRRQAHPDRVGFCACIHSSLVSVCPFHD